MGELAHGHIVFLPNFQEQLRILRIEHLGRLETGYAEILLKRLESHVLVQKFLDRHLEGTETRLVGVY